MSAKIRSRIPKSIRQDNIKIAVVLQASGIPTRGHSRNSSRACLCGSRNNPFWTPNILELRQLWLTGIISDSRRWSAQEWPGALSDWAFGCICCEIWSEGVEPFPHFRLEKLLIIAFSEGSGNALQRKPYQSRPRDEKGVLMPKRLWEFVRLCWKRHPPSGPLFK
ncbi:hypothetical protein K438DRAFT_1931142 [Mycena galopus ATCC 62051]|nr:hypothetical protein K438DRAFT_1931142 [Mycena galopus ATCC 62051]